MATGQFSSPAAVTTDASGNVYVADNANARVVEFSDMLGTNWAVWQFPLNYLTPDGVAVDSAGRIYTTDSLQSQVLRADNISGSQRGVAERELPAATSMAWKRRPGFSSMPTA